LRRIANRLQGIIAVAAASTVRSGDRNLQRSAPVARKTKKKHAELVGLVGLGLDNEDGHRRITRGEEFLLLGGSAETHERMQDVAIQVTESLQHKGKCLRDASAEELADLVRKAMER
jgi:hypothetical protein